MGFWRWLTRKDGSATASGGEGAGLTIPVSTAAETVDLATPAVPNRAGEPVSAVPKVPTITSSLLKQLGWTDPTGYAPHMAQACAAYGITRRQRLACFLG
jgi:hypothetical protein